MSLVFKLFMAVLSPLGLAVAFVVGAGLDLAVMQTLREAELLERAEERLLTTAELLAIAAALLLVGTYLWPLKRTLLAAALVVGFGLVFVEIGAICLSPQQAMTPEDNWGLRGALILHGLALLVVKCHWAAQFYLDRVHASPPASA